MRQFKNLKARIFKSIITWSAMGKQTTQAKEVYSKGRLKKLAPLCRVLQNTYNIVISRCCFTENGKEM